MGYRFELKNDESMLNSNSSPEAAGWEIEFGHLLERAARRFGIDPKVVAVDFDFPVDYRASLPPRLAARDALALMETDRLQGAVFGFKPMGRSAGDGAWRLTLCAVAAGKLDEILPLLRNLGLRVLEQTHYTISFKGRPYSLRDFRVEAGFSGIVWTASLRANLTSALEAILREEVEDDLLNGLTLRGALTWKAIDLLRAYCNYYLQIGDRFDQRRIQAAVLANAHVTALLFKYFEARFRPDPTLDGPVERETSVLPIVRQELIEALDAVEDLAEDRILRDLFNLIDSTWRTNFYLPPKGSRRYVSLKIGSLGVINMPSPRPFAEIYVHSTLMEGVHLRGARVARGGVRWSDRPDDFRTEILGLMNTQMVKNAIIVPQGAKGGFVLKPSAFGERPPASRGREAYGLFICGLLDVTDNLHGSVVERPPELLCYDDPDPYLVVAPDKGTANFSDYANEIAAEYGFWLDDAFATGGSNGYHHKKLGITARGAWTCVKRHFREMGSDIDEQILSVVGVGGMEGDVFGNGMLMSEQIRLLGAFNGEFIFIDPSPDRHASFAERRRLFETPGSSWDDYDRAKLSGGGGVYRRAAKDILLEEAAREWLGAPKVALDGESIVRLILKAPVDLLWLGGIGCYVKASAESSDEIADRQNDAVRVDAAEVRAKVVGEGANLGFTQRARIEYALKGGRIDTDAIDNSAGVDLSDHEVNLKILMAPNSNRGAALAKREERNLLLRDLSEQVCADVLDESYRQCLCLSLERERCRSNVALFADSADILENAGLLDRVADFFPSRKEILGRGPLGLTRPELAVLTAQARLGLKRALLEADGALEADWARRIGAEYFPQRARGRFAAALDKHLLKREICATVICNRVIDQAGAGFIAVLEGLDPEHVRRAVGLYICFDQILQGERWRAGVRSLDGKMTPERQYELLLQLENALSFLSRWAWDHGRRLEPDERTIAQWREHLRRYEEYLGATPEFVVLSSAAPDAARLLFLDRLRDFPTLVALAAARDKSLAEVAQGYEEFVRCFGLRRIATLLAEFPPRDSWERRLQTSLEDQMRSATARFVGAELQTSFRDCASLLRDRGLDLRLAKVEALRQQVNDDVATLTPFAVFVGELHALVDSAVVGAELGGA